MPPNAKNSYQLSLLSPWMLRQDWRKLTYPRSGGRGWGGSHRQLQPPSQRWWFSLGLLQSGQCFHWANAEPGSGPTSHSSPLQTGPLCSKTLQGQIKQAEREKNTNDRGVFWNLRVSGHYAALFFSYFFILSHANLESSVLSLSLTSQPPAHSTAERSHWRLIKLLTSNAHAESWTKLLRRGRRRVAEGKFHPLSGHAAGAHPQRDKIN